MFILPCSSRKNQNLYLSEPQTDFWLCRCQPSDRVMYNVIQKLQWQRNHDDFLRQLTRSNLERFATIKTRYKKKWISWHVEFHTRFFIAFYTVFLNILYSGPAAISCDSATQNIIIIIIIIIMCTTFWLCYCILPGEVQKQAQCSVLSAWNVHKS